MMSDFSPKPAVPWTPEEAEVLRGLSSPQRIQDYLDSLPYNPLSTCRSPRYVMRHGTAHCTEGAIFAAAALWLIGHRPRIIDLRAVRDDDHLLAVFGEPGAWGGLAKSNTTVLRYREPVYRSLRELVMSYFDMYFNVKAEKTLRSYSRPLDLSQFPAEKWMLAEGDLYWIGERLDRMRHYPLLSAAQIAALRPVDSRLLEAGFLGADARGLFQPD